MRKALMFALFPLSALAMDRCYVESIAGDKSRCDLVKYNIQLSCDGQGMNRTPVCSTTDQQSVTCELREKGLREPKDIWCELPMPAAVNGAQAHYEITGESKNVRYIRAQQVLSKDELEAKRLCAGMSKSIFGYGCELQVLAAKRGVVVPPTPMSPSSAQPLPKIDLLPQETECRPNAMGTAQICRAR